MKNISKYKIDKGILIPLLILFDQLKKKNQIGMMFLTQLKILLKN